jgi:hypothetical protein
MQSAVCIFRDPEADTRGDHFLILGPTDSSAACYTDPMLSLKNPPFEADAVIEVYKASLDRTLIRARLDRTPAERVLDLVKLAGFAEELARAGAALRTARPQPMNPKNHQTQ